MFVKLILMYLSLVVLYVEEGVTIGQINHFYCSLCGLVNNGKM